MYMDCHSQFESVFLNFKNVDTGSYIQVCNSDGTGKHSKHRDSRADTAHSKILLPSPSITKHTYTNIKNCFHKEVRQIHSTQIL